uniref:CSON007649 protein n=1 Tax=Culicoides sonorensis TaxID=179676 RepID=A0A336M0L2_CULSO
MSLNEVLLAIFSFILSIVIVLVVVVIGWYLVWRLFLSRFKLVREVLGQINDDTPTHSAKDSSGRTARKTRRD